MKKLIILLFVLFALNANAQFYTKIKPISSIEFGIKNRYLSFYPYNFDTNIIYKYPNNSLFSDLCIGISYYNFSLTSNIITNFYKSDFSDINFSPFLAEYYFDLFYSYKYIKLGYQHFCSHPVINSNNTDFNDNNFIHDYYNKFYIKIIIR